MKGTEVVNDVDWLAGPDPQREAVEAYIQLLGESKKAPGKQEHEAWPISISLGLLGFQHESHYLTRCPHSWQAAFRAASDFLFSWEETASKQEGGFLCTSVTPRGPQGNLGKKTGGGKTLWDSTVKETINDWTWFGQSQIDH